MTTAKLRCTVCGCETAPQACPECGGAMRIVGRRYSLPAWAVIFLLFFVLGPLAFGILWRNERDRPEGRRLPELLDSFALKTRATLDRLERDAPDLSAARFGIGHIATGCCLSYLDFRFPDLGWRGGRPALAAWHEGFRTRPSAQATEIVDE